MAVIALLHRAGADRRENDGPVDDLVLFVPDRYAFAAELRPVAVLEIDDLVGQRGEGEGVRADIHLAVADTDRKRGALAGADHEVRVIAEDDGDGESALKPLQRFGRRLLRAHIAAQEIRDEMGDDLGVGLGAHLVAARRQLLAQLAEILDDAVMDDGDDVGRMGMGVDLVRHAVGSPTGMADADPAGQGVLLQAVGQFGQLALGAAALDMAVHEGGDPGGVITAIFEPLQPLDDQGSDVPFRDDSDDPAHIPFSPWSACVRPIGGSASGPCPRLSPPPCAYDTAQRLPDG